MTIRRLTPATPETRTATAGCLLVMLGLLLTGITVGAAVRLFRWASGL